MLNWVAFRRIRRHNLANLSSQNCLIGRRQRQTWQHNSTSSHHSAVNSLTGHLNCSRKGQLQLNPCLTGGLCMKSCKTYELLIGRPLQREIHTRWCVYFLRVYMCKRVYVCVGPWLTGCWHILITLGSCCFWPQVAGCGSSTSHILRHYILLSTTHGEFDYDNVIKKTKQLF